MKHNKIIYLTAFLLSLSLILLLEASSLRLLAEDIKLSQKKEVEVELLLSASNNSAEENTQAVNKEEFKESKGKQETNDSREKETINKEVDKSSSAVKKEEIKEENEEKVEVENEPKEESKKEKTTEPPAWMQNSSNKSEKVESEKKEAKNKEDEFDLDSFIANLEEETKKKVDTDENKNEQEADDNQSGQSSTSEENNKTVDKDGTEEKASNNSPDNSDDERNKTNSENKVYDLRKGGSDSIKKPGISKYNQPEYPSNLRQRDIEGRVIVTLRIDTEGKIHDLKINKSSGYDSFDQAALKAVSSWEFKAAEKDGKKVEVIVNLPIRFQLN